MSDAEHWRRDRKIVSMPGAASCTPEVVLARTLEKAKAGHIQGVAIAIVWKDGGVASDWSVFPMPSMCYALRCLQVEMDDALRDQFEDCDDLGRPSG